VTGAGGMLGRDLVDCLESAGEQVHGLTHGDLDITAAASVASTFADHRPDVVVNCAAWTAVDDAESHESEALQVNAVGARVLAERCARARARMLQVSTDYVFSGDGTTPYAEDAEPNPRTAYGRTKLAGEEAVLSTLPGAAAVVRTAWLYGEHGGNFVATMIRLEAERESLEVVADQRGQPTWTADVAAQLLRLGRRPAAAGIYHATSSGEATWCDLAREVFTLLGSDPERVHPTTTDRFPRPAPRPAYSVLGHERWGELDIAPIRHWKTALAEAFHGLRRGTQPVTDRSRGGGS
jgi:dTDP-4-dehydrorhamnose reductase